MFSVLIVDDEFHAVEGIKKAVDWEKAGVSSVYTAYNIQQAKEIFKEADGIDLLLCDIEMPLGSGLELLEWVKENQLETESIFLTCHEDFHYAKKAIQLGCLDYLLKPVPIPELENVMAKALKKRVEENNKSQTSHYGQFWLQHQPLLIERFWLDILNRTIPSQKEAISQAAEERNIPFSNDLRFVPVLIVVKRWHKPLSKRETKILEFALRNSAEELLLKHSVYGHLLNWGEGSLLAILSFQHYGEAEARILKESCASFIASCADYFYCDLNSYIGHLASAHELPAMTDKLLIVDRNSVAQDNLVIQLDEVSVTPEAHQNPEFAVWSTLLTEGQADKLMDEISRFLAAASLAKGLDAKRLHQFQQDLLQLLYTFLQAKGIHARQLFSDDQSMEMSLYASRSVKDMNNWSRHIVGKATQYVRTVEQSDSVVDKAKAYIKQNLDQSLTREDIAKHVFLNADYLDRIFKKVSGVSVTEYTVRERIAVAKQLLGKTGIPVHAVALQVGFTNFSHFARIFRKYTDRNPLEFRQEEQKH